MNWIKAKKGDVMRRDAVSGIAALHHVFDQDEINAVNAALAAQRPLLVRGEPGVGKSQLARAAAVALRRTYVSHTVDISTEANDLKWRFDAVARLAMAQMLGALYSAGLGQCATAGVNASKSKSGKAETGAKAGSEEAIMARLAEENFLYPGPLWWAFAWEDAAAQAEKAGLAPPPLETDCEPSNGCVVLIDEIDKAESDVPNGLLEALGSGAFNAPGQVDQVVVSGPPPLVIITTNEERVLPDAFLRRCLVLKKQLPQDDAELQQHLVERAKAHFDKENEDWSELFNVAAKQLIGDRKHAKQNHWRPLPGQAEYLDLVRVLLHHPLPEGQTRLAWANDVMARLARFTLHKDRDAEPAP